MNDKINEYVDGVFAAYEGTKSVSELKADLLADLQERYRDLRAEGKDEATAFEMTVDSIGDIEETVQEVSSLSRVLERQVVTRFDSSALEGTDFAGVSARGGKFGTSALRGSNFSNADLTGSKFKSSDLTDTNFDGANLTDAVLTTAELKNSTFRRARLVRTDFSTSGLDGVVFADSALVDVKFRTTELRRTIFERCTFTGVDFSISDLRGLNFDGASFTGVKFDRAGLEGVSMRGATLRDCSFRGWSRKYYKALRTVNFEGARMDKLTFAALKGFGVEPANVIVE
ncbi:pentapeptide repeat-containing protein [Catelliglobosispora koreensis]|uniref:pentapeptide repeat-containing protein n=1 Tax=Catelliglobosispora koreensis TaxID=129052 RepID=UPI000367E277|nr:pentapeptide repeat-containing protein [Catelliglobosispora koreensis]